ncbi:hypothetical protein B0H10DRAFT_1904954 [Mycena sp. CBHHK59/15]|nr:hypothetical protein B0H10DRAFT_1904954 [Mycena sp. CBHHK59/15]
MSLMPSLDYPITRTYPGRIFAPAAFGGAFVVLLFLAVINSALAGYDTVTGFASDFNVTQSHWFDRFLPPAAKAKPGTLCAPRLLGLGDTITTNYTLFQYSIASIDTANAGDSGFSYQAWTLDNCDITSLYVNGDLNSFIIEYTAVVSCRADAYQILQGNNFEITARADWYESLLAGKYPSLLGAQKASKNRRAGTYNKSMDARGSVLDSIMAVSSAEFGERVIEILELTNNTSPTIISFQADFPWCPASLGRDAPCAVQVPPVNITAMFEYIPNFGGVQYFATDPSNQTLVNNDTSGIISNTVQAVYAAVRLDLGNRSPNNFLLNTSMIPEAVLSSFPQTHPPRAGIVPMTESYLYSILVNDGFYSKNVSSDYDIPGLLPLASPGPAVLDGVYLCQFQQRKPLGSAFIAVLVATISMFGTGWGIFLGFAEGMVKKREGANTCEEHTMLSNASSADSREKEPFVE